MMNDPMLTPETSARVDGYVPFAELEPQHQACVSECYGPQLAEMNLDHTKLWWVYQRNTARGDSWGCMLVRA